MRIFICIALLFFSSSGLLGQTLDSIPKVNSDEFGPAPEDTDEPVLMPDRTPMFPGGDSAWAVFVQDHMTFPARCQQEGISGKVVLRFIVGIDGRISNILPIDTTKSCPEFTNEAIRVLKMSPLWIPAQVNGKFVKCYMQIPIRFYML